MQKGFSLVEILVSISIITIVSGIGVQTYATAQRSAKLKADVITVTSAIRIAQNRALSPSRGDLGMGATDKLCAMGVKFYSQNKLQPYYVVKDGSDVCNDNQNYGAEIILSNANFGTASGEFEFGLPFANNNSSVSSVQLELAGTNISSKKITVTDSGLIKIE
jgi:prepilin-type N-terminal cleavage/methylation domain-containing protein